MNSRIYNFKYCTLSLKSTHDLVGRGERSLVAIFYCQVINLCQYLVNSWAWTGTRDVPETFSILIIQYCVAIFVYWPNIGSSCCVENDNALSSIELYCCSRWQQCAEGNVNSWYSQLMAGRPRPLWPEAKAPRRTEGANTVVALLSFPVVKRDIKVEAYYGRWIQTSIYRGASQRCIYLAGNLLETLVCIAHAN